MTLTNTMIMAITRDMNKITRCIATHETQQPQNYQYESNRPQHMISLPHCLGSLTAATFLRQQSTSSRVGLELGLSMSVRFFTLFTAFVSVTSLVSKSSPAPR